MGRIVVSQFVTVDGVMEDPGGSEDMERGGWAFQFNRGEDGDKFNTMPKYVVSSTLSDPEWSNSTVIGTDDLAKLKDDEDGVILVNGSRRLVDELVEQGLVDEFRLMVFPIVLGMGKQLFGDTSGTKSLELVESKPVGPEGVLVLVYRPK